MNAVIMPLNKFMYNHETYDGISWMEKFGKRFPVIEIFFFDTKVGYGIMKYLIAVP